MAIQTPTIPSIPSLSGGSLSALKSLANINATPSMAAKRLLEIFNPQNKNLFEVIFLPSNSLSFSSLASAGTSALSLLASALDSAVTKTHIQSIDVPFLGIEYEEYNQQKSPSHLKYPETMTMTFIENEEGVVRKYLNSLMTDIVKLSTDLRGNYHYVFNANAHKNKKRCLIIPATSMGLPSVGWIQIEGMRYAGMENVMFDQKEGEPMYITATFSIENAWWKVISNPF